MSADMEAAVKLFFSSPRFAVAGASTDASKFGYKSTKDTLSSAGDDDDDDDDDADMVVFSSPRVVS